MSTYELIAILALVGYAIYRQTRTHAVTGQNRFKLAIIYTMVGVIIGFQMPHTAATVGLLIVGLLASLGVGLLRGRKSLMWRGDDGTVYTRGTALTIGLFLALVAFKFGLGTVAYFAHVPYESGIGEVLVMVGVMLAVQAELIWRRAQSMAPAGRSQNVHALAA
jgi:hypothetical protein